MMERQRLYTDLCAQLGDTEMQLERNDAERAQLERRREEIRAALRAVDRFTSVELGYRKKFAASEPTETQ